MHRIPKQNQWRPDLQEWKGVQWELTLDVNSRMVVERIEATATKRAGDTLTAKGHAWQDVAPFDNLREMVVATLIEAAMNAVDELVGGEQLSIPFSPHER